MVRAVHIRGLFCTRRATDTTQAAILPLLDALYIECKYEHRTMKYKPLTAGYLFAIFTLFQFVSFHFGFNVFRLDIPTMCLRSLFSSTRVISPSRIKQHATAFIFHHSLVQPGMVAALYLVDLSSCFSFRFFLVVLFSSLSHSPCRRTRTGRSGTVCNVLLLISGSN